VRHDLERSFHEHDEAKTEEERNRNSQNVSAQLELVAGWHFLLGQGNFFSVRHFDVKPQPQTHK
jgi:hypothetical protein